MNKKTLIIIIAAIIVIAAGVALALTLRPAAQPPVTPQIDVPAENQEFITGKVTEVTDEWILITDENGQEFQANLTDKTEFEGEKPVVGCQVTVLYNGVMTRSLPPQVAAIKVTCPTFTGVVEELAEDGFLLRRTDVDDVVFVHATADQLDTLAVDANVTVYFNGIVALSLPGQITADVIVLN